MWKTTSEVIMGTNTRQQAHGVLVPIMTSEVVFHIRDPSPYVDPLK
jgi:hypothetical protein